MAVIFVIQSFESFLERRVPLWCDKSHSLVSSKVLVIQVFVFRTSCIQSSSVWIQLNFFFFLPAFWPLFTPGLWLVFQYYLVNKSSGFKVLPLSSIKFLCNLGLFLGFPSCPIDVSADIHPAPHFVSYFGVKVSHRASLPLSSSF